MVKMFNEIHKYLLLVCLTGLCTNLHIGDAFKYHEFCSAPPLDMKTRFPLYRLDVDTKTEGVPWAYRQNSTLTVSVKALYQKYKIKQIFMSVPSMTKGTPEIPAKKIHLGEWKWDMKGGVIPIDCSNTASGFGGAANAVRNLWWYKDGFYNITGEWDPVNTIYNAYNIDMIQFEVYVSPDEEDTSSQLAVGAAGPSPQAIRWVKLVSDKFINLDYIDLHRWLRSVYGPYNPHLYNRITDTEV
ncbi:uncharacterized protein LOC106052463 isoform X1 [Biomphalaria glabrata]|uniref:Uncharacterized protein LOC106052463 isoform X1 n=1 Tax=Biomphalaria glabrata TaxID=6526 RepID=A0A9W2YMN5_BIOGL|nr:uncharacterized protein LOC106052463 isoform X1 [Biomphalaria glabrata]XP_055864049.1 uncharacterized protein LOC106052463 isoform X1 [Biomphalaria glabrata]